MARDLNSEQQEAASRTWGASGAAYDDMSYMVSDALAHAAQRLAVQAEEAVLDVATGTGWTARNLARNGARVTAIDLSEELLAAAKELSAHITPPIAFQRADAQDLPFEDGQFDVVASTFGVMFAPDQVQAARELARVCRPGGRLGVAAWPPELASSLAVISKYSDEPPLGPSALLWGDPAHVEALLGEDFHLVFEPGVNRSYHADGEELWQLYLRSFGPTKQLYASLDATRRAAFHADMVAHFEELYRTDIGLRAERPYLLILGTRR